MPQEDRLDGAPTPAGREVRSKPLQVTIIDRTPFATDVLAHAHDLMLTAVAALQIDAALIDSETANAIAVTVNDAISLVGAVQRELNKAYEPAAGELVGGKAVRA